MHKNCIKLLVVTLLHYTGSQAQPLSNYQKQCAFFLQNEGKWITSDPAKYYGYEFSKGLGPNSLQLKISVYKPVSSEWITGWIMYYTWDPKEQKVIYHGQGSDGAVATGISENISENELTITTTITAPDGSSEKRKEVLKPGNNQFESVSHTLKGDKWENEKANLTFTPRPIPNGNLTFMSTRDGNFEIYSMDAKGENLKNLSCNKATDYAFSYFPNSARFTFYTNRDGNDEIYIQEADGRKQMNITNHPAGDRIPFVSPDGKRILFLSDRDHKSGEIYMMDADGKNLNRLTTNEYFEDNPNWSPDGKKIYFTRELRDLKDTGRNALTNGEIFVMDTDGSNAKQLTNRPGYDGGPAPSPDGSRIAFYGKSEKGHYDIFIMNADGSNLVNITGDSAEDYSPCWSPDGNWIACTRGDNKNYDIWLIHLRTGIKTRLTTNPRRDESPIWLREP